MDRVVSLPRLTRMLRKSVGQADSHRLQPTQSSVRGAEARAPALFAVEAYISNTSVGQALTHCVQPMQLA